MLGDDPIFTADIRTPFGTLDVMAEVDVAERTLVLEGLHIGGDPARTWGAASLLRLVQAVMDVLDVDEIRVVGAVRTTVANPGRSPRVRRFRRTPQPPASSGR